MSRLKQMKGTPEIFKYEDVELEIKSLPFRDFTEVNDLHDKNKKKEAIDLLLYKTIRYAIPLEEATDEELKKEIDDLPLKVVMDIVKVMLRVNGMDDKKLLKKITPPNLKQEKE